MEADMVPDCLDDGDALISPRVARAMSGDLSESTIVRLIACGDYPAPVVLSRNRHGRPCRIAFRRGDVLNWCRRRIAAQHGPATAAAE
jgi:predicted DNA-binding transcriptional regulator AlpA